MAILATMTHPYFKLRWLPHTLFDQRSCLQSLFVSTVKHHAMMSGASSDARAGLRHRPTRPWPRAPLF